MRFFELVVAFLGTREFHQFDLLKLVLADDAAHVTAIRTGLAAETRRVGAEADGQTIGVESFVAIQVGDGNFGGGDQPEVMFLTLEEVVGEFGQLAGAEQAGGVDHERRQNLGVAVLARVDVEHEVDEGALEARADAPVDGEAGAGDFGGTLEIQDAEFGAKIPVGFGLEIELARLAAAADLHVVIGTAADGHGFMRQVRDAGEEIAELIVERP